LDGKTAFKPIFYWNLFKNTIWKEIHTNKECESYYWMDSTIINYCFTLYVSLSLQIE